MDFYTCEGFTAPLYNQNAFGTGVDTENWLNFGAGLVSSLLSNSHPWAGTHSHAQAALRVFSLAWTLWEIQVPKPEPRFCPAKLNKSRGAENLTWDLSRRNLHLNLWIIGVIPGIRMLLEQLCHCSNGITAVFLPFLIFFLFVLSNIESNFKNVIQSPFVSHTESQCLKPLRKQRHSLAFYCCLFKSV